MKLRHKDCFVRSWHSWSLSQNHWVPGSVLLTPGRGKGQGSGALYWSVHTWWPSWPCHPDCTLWTHSTVWSCSDFLHIWNRPWEEKRMKQVSTVCLPCAVAQLWPYSPFSLWTVARYGPHTPEVTWRGASYVFKVIWCLMCIRKGQCYCDLQLIEKYYSG
jgi:hypothetical protein